MRALRRRAGGAGCVALLLAWSGAAQAQRVTPPRDPVREAERREAAQREAARRAAARAGAIQRAPGRRSSGDSGIVDEKVLRVSVPAPVARSGRDPAPIGFYAWYLLVPSAEPFAMVITSDTALHTADADEIARAVTLRLCETPDPASLHDCVTPVLSRLTVRDERLWVTISDPRIVSRVQRTRPLHYERSSIEPRGRVHSGEAVWVYRYR